MTPVSLADALPEILRSELSELRGARQPFIEWALKVPEPKTGTLDFKRYAFQRELYTEGADDEEMAIRKATQVGISAYLLRWIMYHCDLRALTGLYTFPKKQQMYDFADARIKPAILGSDYLRRRIERGTVNNKGLKRIGAGLLYCRGSESIDDLQAIDADVLVLDEYEDLRQENIPDAERRLGNSQLGLKRRVGVPRIPGRGVDKLYMDSDRRQWFVRCECGERQPLEYGANVDEEKLALLCRDRDCRKPLDVTKGEWVAEYPERDVRGYHISRLLVPGMAGPGTVHKLHEIVGAHHKTAPYEIQAHHNYDLGLAYAPREGRLLERDLEDASRDEFKADRGSYSGDGVVTGGLDVASVRNMHCRITLHVNDNLMVPLFLGEIDSFGEAAELMRRFHVNLMVVDHEPEGRLARQFAERFPGKVWLVHFAPNLGEVMRPNAEMREVAVRRVESIDATFASIRQQRKLLPAKGAWPEGYSLHMQNLNRHVEDQEDGRTKVTYAHSGPFDYAMAETYDLVAKAVWQWLGMTTEGIEGEVVPFEERYDFEASDLDRGTTNIEMDIAEYEPGFE